MLVARGGVTADRRGGPVRALEDAAGSAMRGEAGRAKERGARRGKAVDPASALAETGRRAVRHAVLPVVRRAGHHEIGPVRIAVRAGMMTGRALAPASPIGRMRVAFPAQHVSVRNGRIAPMLRATLDGHAAIRRDVVPTHRRLD